MNAKEKTIKILRNPRVLLMIGAIIFALLFISPAPWINGVTISEVQRDSPAALAGIPTPDQELKPVSKERITRVIHDGLSYDIKNIDDYESVLALIPDGSTISIETKKGSTIAPRSTIYRVPLQLRTSLEVNNTETNETIIEQQLTPVSASELGLGVVNVAQNNIRLGIELSGGTRVLIALQERAEPEIYESLIENIRERLNVFGLSDVIVRPSTDLSGDQYILVELAGINNQEIARLLEQQGEFEARIGETTVFIGGEQDIRYICRSAQCSGIDPFQGCREIGGGWNCGFRFEITLST
jgi:hypothetical protein